MPKHLLEIVAVPGKALQNLTWLPLPCCPRQGHCQPQQLPLAPHRPLPALHCLHRDQQCRVRSQSRRLAWARDCSWPLQGRSQLAGRQPGLAQSCCLVLWKGSQLRAELMLLHLL